MMDLDDIEARVDSGAHISGEAVRELVARVRAAEAELDRLRALFDDAGAGEHDVLALVDHYQEEARKARVDRWEAYPRALQAAADVVYQALTCDMPKGIAASILDLSADEIDAFAEQQEAHEAESGER